MGDNILGAMPIKRLVVTMSLPIMCSMLISALYNMVDSVCVAQVGDQEFLALSYAYPVQLLMIACCVGLGVGFNATLSKRLGQGDKTSAVTVVHHGLFLYAVNALVFLAFGLLGAGAFFRMSTSDPVVAALGREYLSICCGMCFGQCLQFFCERILQCTGNPKGFMIVQGSGAVVNLILDPVLIFGFGMGVKGAAVATVIGQITGGLVGLVLISRLGEQLPITLKHFRIQGKVLGEILSIAAPAALMQGLNSVMTLGMNQILNLWATEAVWAMGVYFKVQTFVIMPVNGINNALVSILSYNFGARDRQRVRDGLIFGLKMACGVAAAGSLLLFLIAPPLLQYGFRAEGAGMTLGLAALRIAGLNFPFAAGCFVSCAAFQSLGKSRLALLTAVLRQLVLLLPMAYGFVRFAPEWVWLAFPLAEGFACCAALPLCRRIYLQKTRELP